MKLSPQQKVLNQYSLEITKNLHHYYETGDSSLLATNDYLYMELLPLLTATNFHIRVPKEYAEVLLYEDSEIVMCKEYGEDEDWVGLIKDDLDDKGLLDDDYKTFELWLINPKTGTILNILHEINNHVGPLNPYEYIKEFNI